MPQALRRIYAARGVTDAKTLAHRLAQMHAPDSLTGLDAAATRLADAIDANQSIVIAGDYDCDGATGVAVAVRGLRLLGARQVSYVVPNRFEHGYGLSPALVASLTTTPDLIVTVDNGIASVSGVAAAAERGIDVVVTDHHLPGQTLPKAAAIVNPNLPGDDFPSKALAGVGVMFYVLLALRGELVRRGRFSREQAPDLRVLLDLVALGTVADLVALDRNNRILVDAGMRRMRGGLACAGIAALAEASQRRLETLVASDLGFALAPRLNAAGRLEDMTLGVECLLTEDAGRARELAELLSQINAERRELQATMVADAELMVARAATPPAEVRGVALFDESWHPGVVGLVASRLKERLHRPVVAFAPADEGSADLRGSARSIPGFHIRDALAEVDARHPGLMGPFGGHAMAAGLSLSGARLDEFSAAFDAVARERIAEEALQPVLWTDGELAVDDFHMELAHALRYAGPWGQAFPEPVFDNVFECIDHRPMGRAHRRFKLRDPRNGAVHEAVMFNVDLNRAPPYHLHAAYELTINDWQGRQSLRLLLRHVQDARDRAPV
ncbi:single-stranded-DNA-specific exonuclease RecJ [Oleiagrimonas sp. C23AA]|nr:single-stranded-DNA-specific exonuclease RecJ [Oleiagrimonas sp. C23AA]NII10427.1 single-stranded-DNA-specific exonuclease RecJ [Oleiagrimonas sp. C23AA]